MKTLLHVGCGPKRINQTTRAFNDGTWQEMRLDINPDVQPDVIGTMTDLRSVSTASVQAVFSSHNIEHLYPHEVPLALAEFHRVLDDRGHVVITCPDLKSICRLVAEDKLDEPAYQSPAGPIAPLDVLYGHRRSMQQGNLYMAHRCGFTETTLRIALATGGFGMVATKSRPEHFDLWALACKGQWTTDEVRALAAQHFPL